MRRTVWVVGLIGNDLELLEGTMLLLRQQVSKRQPWLVCDSEGHGLVGFRTQLDREVWLDLHAEPLASSSDEDP